MTYKQAQGKSASSGVKVNIRFKGREMAHQELGMQMAQRIEKDLADEVVIEQRPRLEGRQMIMVLAPKRK